MKKIFSIGAAAGLAVVMSGCAGLFPTQQKAQAIDENEAFKYERQYLAEWEQIKAQFANFEQPFKFIQPKNKKQACKVYVAINPQADKTTRSDYELFWDGECKDGYASGLGREIERTATSDLQQIGYYEGGKAKNYCVQIDKTNGITIEGECSYNAEKADHEVKTFIKNTNTDIDIAYEIGSFGSKNEPGKFVSTNAFGNTVTYRMVYPNFAYSIIDNTKNEFQADNYGFMTSTPNGNNGFMFVNYKNGITGSGEFQNGRLIRSVSLPQSFYAHADEILNEIKKAANTALEAQKQALAIKAKYKAKICKSSVKVGFMDNSEYKAICREDEEFAKLQPKINAKIAQIEQQKAAKREQIYRERMARAAEAQARAAQQQAYAAEQQAIAAQDQAYQMQRANNRGDWQMNELNNNLRRINGNLNGIYNNTLNNNSSPFTSKFTPIPSF